LPPRSRPRTGRVGLRRFLRQTTRQVRATPRNVSWLCACRLSLISESDAFVDEGEVLATRPYPSWVRQTRLSRRS